MQQKETQVEPVYRTTKYKIMNNYQLILPKNMDTIDENTELKFIFYVKFSLLSCLFLSGGNFVTAGLRKKAKN